MGVRPKQICSCFVPQVCSFSRDGLAPSRQAGVTWSGEGAGVVWRRIEGTSLATIPCIGNACFDSPVLGGDVALDRLYRLTAV
jgi:hypothetical protein